MGNAFVPSKKILDSEMIDVQPVSTPTLAFLSVRYMFTIVIFRTGVFITSAIHRWLR